MPGNAIQEAPPQALNKVTVPPALSAPAERSIVINVPSSAAPSEGKGWSDAASSIAGSLAWPITVIVALLIFRAPITRLISRLRTLKGAGMEVSTEEMIQDELPDRAPPADAAEIDPWGSPIDTIVTSWVKVEKAVRDAVIRANLNSGSTGAPYATVLSNADQLRKAGLIQPELRPLISDLARIRNQAIHSPEEPVSRAALKQFVANAEWAISMLDNVGR